jgi:hypothetical protein
MTRRALFALALAILLLLAGVALAYGDCAIGWPDCPVDTISPAVVRLPVVMR